jgi:hypothetical protein
VSRISGWAGRELRTFDVRRNVPLPCDAARIPAAQYGLDMYVQVDQPLAMRANWHVICTTHNPKQSGMWMSATLGIGTVHISGEAIFR